MGRWADMDGDEYRLPSGIKRIGYDTDTQKYTFHEASTGRYYESAPGSRYGTLYPITPQNHDHRFAPRRSHTFGGTPSKHNPDDDSDTIKANEKDRKRDSGFSQSSTIVAFELEDDDAEMDEKKEANRVPRSSILAHKEMLVEPPKSEHYAARRRRAQTFEGILNEPARTVADASEVEEKEGGGVATGVLNTLKRFGSKRVSNRPAGGGARGRYAQI